MSRAVNCWKLHLLGWLSTGSTMIQAASALPNDTGFYLYWTYRSFIDLKIENASILLAGATYMQLLHVCTPTAKPTCSPPHTNQAVKPDLLCSFFPLITLFPKFFIASSVISSCHQGGRHSFRPVQHDAARLTFPPIFKGFEKSGELQTRMFAN